MSVHRPHPRTIASIELQRLADHFDGFNCGCHQAPAGSGRWRLCQYHEGFEDGLEAGIEHENERGARS